MEHGLKISNEMGARKLETQQKSSPAIERSVLELAAFGVFFVLVFSAIARAEAGTSKAPGTLVSAGQRPSSASTVSALRGGAPQALSGASPRAVRKASSATLLHSKHSKHSKHLSQATGSGAGEPSSSTSAPASVPASAQAVSSSTSTGSESNAQASASASNPNNSGKLNNGDGVGQTSGASDGNLSSRSAITYAGTVTLQTNRTLDVNEPASYSGWYGLSFGASHKSTKSAINVRLGYAQEYSYQRDDGTDGSLDNPSLALSKRFNNNEEFRAPVAGSYGALIDTISVALTGALPGNLDAQKQTFRGSVGSSLTLAKSLGRLNLSQGFGYTRRFYEFDIRDSGVVNSPDAWRSTTSLSLDLNDRFSLEASMGLTYLVSYQGVGRTTEASMLSAGYNLSKKLSMSMGVATDRGTLEVDGQTNTVRIFDPNQASAFFELTLAI